MNFHRAGSLQSPLDLPVLLGHFVPWYALDAAAYPFPDEWAKDIDYRPPVENMRHWCDARAGYRRTHLHWPEIGVYDSRQPQAIEWQIRAALEHGVQGFIVNWYGKNSVENLITLHWLKGLNDWNAAHPGQPFCYFISFDSQAQWPSEGKRPVTMEEDFRYIKDHLITDAYLCRDGRPIFSVFPYEDNCAQWRRAMNSVFGAEGADLIWMNGTPRQGETAAFPWVRPDDAALSHEGFYPWKDPDNAGDDFLRSFYERCNEAQGRLDYIMGGVWPGFDDQLVSWAWNATPENPSVRPRVICRETSRGNTLELTWKALLDYLRQWADGNPQAAIPCPLIQIVTWNDYAEASTVEPTKDYGCKPLEICQANLQTARRIWAEAKNKL